MNPNEMSSQPGKQTKPLRLGILPPSGLVNSGQNSNQTRPVRLGGPINLNNSQPMGDSGPAPLQPVDDGEMSSDDEDAPSTSQQSTASLKPNAGLSSSSSEDEGAAGDLNHQPVDGMSSSDEEDDSRVAPQLSESKSFAPNTSIPGHESNALALQKAEEQKALKESAHDQISSNENNGIHFVQGKSFPSSGLPEPSVSKPSQTSADGHQLLPAECEKSTGTDQMQSAINLDQFSERACPVQQDGQLSLDDEAENFGINLSENIPMQQNANYPVSEESVKPMSCELQVKGATEANAMSSDSEEDGGPMISFERKTPTQLEVVHPPSDQQAQNEKQGDEYSSDPPKEKDISGLQQPLLEEMSSDDEESGSGVANNSSFNQTNNDSAPVDQKDPAESQQPLVEGKIPGDENSMTVLPANKTVDDQPNEAPKEEQRLRNYENEGELSSDDEGGGVAELKSSKHQAEEGMSSSGSDSDEDRGPAIKLSQNKPVTLQQVLLQENNLRGTLAQTPADKLLGQKQAEEVISSSESEEGLAQGSNQKGSTQPKTSAEKLTEQNTAKEGISSSDSEEDGLMQRSNKKGSIQSQTSSEKLPGQNTAEEGISSSDSEEEGPTVTVSQNQPLVLHAGMEKEDRSAEQVETSDKNKPSTLHKENEKVESSAEQLPTIGQKGPVTLNKLSGSEEEPSVKRSLQDQSQDLSATSLEESIKVDNSRAQTDLKGLSTKEKSKDDDSMSSSDNDSVTQKPFKPTEQKTKDTGDRMPSPSTDDDDQPGFIPKSGVSSIKRLSEGEIQSCIESKTEDGTGKETAEDASPSLKLSALNSKAGPIVKLEESAAVGMTLSRTESAESGQLIDPGGTPMELSRQSSVRDLSRNEKTESGQLKEEPEKDDLELAPRYSPGEGILKFNRVKVNEEEELAGLDHPFKASPEGENKVTTDLKEEFTKDEAEMTSRKNGDVRAIKEELSTTAPDGQPVSSQAEGSIMESQDGVKLKGEALSGADSDIEDGEIEGDIYAPPAPTRDDMDTEYDTDLMSNEKAALSKRPRSGSYDGNRDMMSSSDEDDYFPPEKRSRLGASPKTAPSFGDKATSLEKSTWKKYDAKGKAYYYNDATGKTQWNRPEISDQEDGEEGRVHKDDDYASSDGGSPVSDLGAVDAEKIESELYFLGDLIRAGPWREYVDDRNQRYYHNRETGATQWEEPEPIAEIRMKRFEQYLRELDPMDSSMDGSMTGGSTLITQHPSVSSMSDLDYSQTISMKGKEGEDNDSADANAPQLSQVDEVKEDKEEAEQKLMKISEIQEETKEIDEDPKVLFERFLAEYKAEEQRDSHKIELEDPATKLQQTDAIMENDCLSWIGAYKDKMDGKGAPFSLPVIQAIVSFLSDNFRGYTQHVRHLGTWIKQLQPEEEFDVEEFILNRLEAQIERYFDAESADKVLERYPDCPDYLRVMMAKKRWRNVLLKLFNRHENSALLGFCVRQLSAKGFHHDIAEVLSRPDDFSVFRGCVVALISEVITTPTYCTGLTLPPSVPIGTSSAVSRPSLQRAKSSVVETTPASSGVLLNLRNLTCASAHGFLFVQELLRRLENRTSELSRIPPKSKAAISENNKPDKKKDEKKPEEDIEQHNGLTETPSYKMCGRKFRRIRQEIGAGATQLLKTVDNRLYRNRLEFLQKMGAWHRKEVLDRHRAIIIAIGKIISEQKVIGSALEELCEFYKLKEKPRQPNDSNAPIKFIDQQNPSGDSGGQPPVKYLRHPEILEILTDSLFSYEEQRRSSMGPSSDLRSTALLLVYATHTDTQSIDMEQVQQIADQLQQAASLLVDVVKRHKLYSVIEDELFSIMEIPVCSMGILRYVTYQLHQNAFQRSTRYPALCPFFVSICKRALHEHGIQRSAVFEVLRLILTTKVETEIKKAMDIQRGVLNCMVHLISKGYVLPIFEFLQEPSVVGQIDHTLLRHFIGTVVSIALPPYSTAFQMAFSSFLTISTVSTAVCSSNFDDQFRIKLHSYISDCIENPNFEKNDTLQLLKTKLGST